MSITDGMKDIVDDMEHSRTERTADIAELKKDVTGIRLDAVNMVHGFADERVVRGIELTRMLKTYNDGIVQDVQQLMDDFDKQRALVQEDLAEAHGIWQSHMGNEHTTARPKLKTVHKVTKAPGKGKRKRKT